MEEERRNKIRILIEEREAKIARGEDRHQAWSAYLDDFNRVEIEIAKQENGENDN